MPPFQDLVDAVNAWDIIQHLTPSDVPDLRDLFNTAWGNETVTSENPGYTLEYLTARILASGVYDTADFVGAIRDWIHSGTNLVVHTNDALSGWMGLPAQEHHWPFNQTDRIGDGWYKYTIETDKVYKFSGDGYFPKADGDGWPFVQMNLLLYAGDAYESITLESEAVMMRTDPDLSLYENWTIYSYDLEIPEEWGLRISRGGGDTGFKADILDGIQEYVNLQERRGRTPPTMDKAKDLSDHHTFRAFGELEAGE